jgi:hypothetical protein
MTDAPTLTASQTADYYAAKKLVSVSITITVEGDADKTFAAEATTASDPYRVAGGLLDGLRADAGEWARTTGFDRREGRR